MHVPKDRCGFTASWVSGVASPIFVGKKSSQYPDLTNVGGWWGSGIGGDFVCFVLFVCSFICLLVRAFVCACTNACARGCEGAFPWAFSSQREAPSTKSPGSDLNQGIFRGFLNNYMFIGPRKPMTARGVTGFSKRILHLESLLLFQCLGIFPYYPTQILEKEVTRENQESADDDAPTLQIPACRGRLSLIMCSFCFCSWYRAVPSAGLSGYWKGNFVTDAFEPCFKGAWVSDFPYVLRMDKP